MKKLIYGYLVTFMLLFTLISTLNGGIVSATYVDVVGFENLNVQADFSGVVDDGLVYLVTGATGNEDNNDITADYTWSGNSRTLKGRCNRQDVSEDSNYYINFTEDYTYIGAVDIWFYINDVGATAVERDTFWYFYNNTGGSLSEVLRISYEKDTDDVLMLDSLGAWKVIADLSGVGVANQLDGYYHLKISHVSGNTMNYSLYNESESLIDGIEDTSRSIADWTNITHFRFQGYENNLGGAGGDYVDTYFDTFRFGFDSVGQTYGDISGLNSFCLGQSDISVVTANAVLEQRVDVNFKGYIRAVDLHLGSSVHGFEGVDSSLSWYSLYINGFVIGSPDYWIPNGDGWTLRWVDFSVSLDGEYPLFEFLANIPTIYLGSGLTRWDIVLSDTFSVPDARYSTDLSQWGDNVFNGKVKTYPHDKPIAFCYYYDTYITPPSYNDSVNVVGGSVFREFENILFKGELSVGNPDTYVRIYHDTIQFTSQGYGGLGKKVSIGSSYIFTGSFVPDGINYAGDWNISLWRGGVPVAWSENFSVVDLDDWQYNGLIYTDPNPSRIGETFRIGWLYDKSYYGNNDGIIIYSDFPDFASAYGSYNVLKGNIHGHGNTTFTLGTEGAYYIFLCENENGSYKPIDMVEHNVGEVLTNGLWVRDSVLEVYPDSDIESDRTAIQKFYGYHSHYGEPVYLRVNGQDLEDLTIRDSFEFEWTFYESGNYFCELVVYRNSTELVVDTAQFMIVDVTPEDEGTVGGISVGFWKLIAGLIIMVFTAILPTLITRDAPAFTNGISAVIGLAICIHPETALFDIWTAMLVALILIIVIIIGIKKTWS